MANVTDAHRAWIAEAVAAPFCNPRHMQTTMPRRPPAARQARVAVEPLPDLFRDLLLDAEPAPALDSVGMPVGDLLRAHFGEALPGPSALTAKRRERRRQREEAAEVEAAEAAEKARRERELPPLDPGVVMQEAEFVDKVEVMEALYDIVPRGVPPYYKATLAVHRSPDGIIANVRVFDDEIGCVEITGPKGARGYRWHHSGVAGTAFHWNEGARCWERIPDLCEAA